MKLNEISKSEFKDILKDPKGHALLKATKLLKSDLLRAGIILNRITRQKMGGNTIGIRFNVYVDAEQIEQVDNLVDNRFHPLTTDIGYSYNKNKLEYQVYYE